MFYETNFLHQIKINIYLQLGFLVNVTCSSTISSSIIIDPKAFFFTEEGIKSEEEAVEESNLEFRKLKLTQLGFQAHPTKTPTRKPIQTGTINTIISTTIAPIVGLSKISRKASTTPIPTK